MDGSHLWILYAPVHELVEWIDGRGPAPLPPRLDKVVDPSTWVDYTNQTDPSALPNRHLLPPTTIDAPDASQTTPTTEPIPPLSSHTSFFQTSHSSTNLAITLVKPRPVQGSAVVVLPRIETHVYLDIGLPSRSWNAVQLPCTKSVTSDDSSTMGEGIKPLLLDIIVRGATTRQECNRVCEKCKKRMGNKTGPPSLIDFHGPSNILTPKGGVVQIHFTFSCYSRHHQKEDEQYVLEVIIKDASDPSKPRVVSRKELPYSFDVRSSRPRVKEPTSDQTQRANTNPSSNIRRGMTNEQLAES